MYFQAFEINFRATEKVFICGAKKKCTQGEEKVYAGRGKSAGGLKKLSMRGEEENRAEKEQEKRKKSSVFLFDNKKKGKFARKN
ncbi:MAG: hypothetical protein IJ615_04860 [Bacteroidaceae bacterium]|nr:hypothetical protein [Bacteroidaceae bacterium]